MTAIDRRQLLRLAAASATTLWLPRSAWAQPRLPEQPFALGVASGWPTARSLVLWTRLVGAGGGGFPSLPLEAGPVTVRWELADDEGFTRIVRSGQAQALPELAHAVHVELDGLAPDRWYHYRFMAGDAVSTTGRARTLPAPGAQPGRLKLAYASCQRWEHGRYAAWRHLAQEGRPDLVLFVGDYIYEYPGARNAVRSVPGGWVTDLASYRLRHAVHKSDPALQAAHAACPWLVTWDDHEVQNDYAGLTPGNTGPEVADFAARRAAAYQAYYEHMPLPASVLTRGLGGLMAGAETRLYASFQYGQLARIALLDGRQYRSPQVCTPEGRRGGGLVPVDGCPALADPARSMFGAGQEAWLDARLAEAGRAGTGWTVLAQDLLFGRRDADAGLGKLVWNDAWDGYAPARRRLTDALQRHRVPNPVILGGDIHENWVGHVKADYDRPDSASVGVEFCGTSISSRASSYPGFDKLVAENPHFVFADRDRRGYGLVTLTPQRLETELRAVRDVADAESPVDVLARFGVASGRAELEHSLK